ncbi:MAG: fluoride efflux transporter CrcB [Methylacidiphilales bacterium]|nr:fluoride efflux transporter CrcB [Candidatus Methylacidiphilales bacterium]MDW8349628.1 fluoride efflux transporter CrcB [Verrucomicrobiae bacterium]
MTWRDYFWIGLGSGLGGVFRVFLSRFFDRVVYSYPWGTFWVNFIGCFLIGWLWMSYGVKLAVPRYDVGWNLIASGFLGGFTTFSTFTLQAAELWSEGQWTLSIVYSVVTCGACIFGVALGMLVGGIRIGG